MTISELESELHLDRAHVLRPVRCAEPGVFGLHAGGVERAVGVELRVAHGQVRRAVQLKLRYAAVDDDGVEHIERVDAELRLPISAKTDVARNREIGRLVEAST